MSKLTAETHKNHTPDKITAPCLLISEKQGVVVLVTVIDVNNRINGVVVDPGSSSLVVGSTALEWWVLDMFKPFNGVVKIKSEIA